MQFGPFHPVQDEPVLFAFRSDETTLFAPLEKLPPIHLKQHEISQDSMGMYQTAMCLVGDAKDGVVINSKFQEGEWRTIFEWIYRCFASLDVSIIPKKNINFLPADQFYSNLIQLDHSYPLVSIFGFGHANKELMDSPQLLEIVQRLNSKMEFVRLAKDRKLPMPPSLPTSKGDLDSQEVAAFFRQHGPEVVLKLSGVGGGCNVKQVDSADAVRRHLEEFSVTTELLLQKRLDLSKYSDMTVDFVITDTECTIANVRHILADNFRWMGNYLHKSLSLSDREEKTLLECARWLQEEGYFHPKGYLCGVDFFRTDTDLCLSEMNTRWTGGHIPARLVDKLAMGSADVYFIADRFSPDKMKTFQTFVDNNMYHPGVKVSDFKVLPLGIVPLYTDDDGSKISKVLMMVIGNIHAYTEAKNRVFGEGDLPRANIIAAKMI